MMLLFISVNKVLTLEETLFLALQEFISTACIEHLDFLTIDPESGQHFRRFSEKEMGKSFRSLTDIPKLVQSVEKESWMSEQVSSACYS